MPQQYSGSRSPERGAALKAPRSARTKDSGGAGAETPTAPSPYQEAKGDRFGLELGWHHEASVRSRPNADGTGALFFRKVFMRRSWESPGMHAAFGLHRPEGLPLRRQRHGTGLDAAQNEGFCFSPNGRLFRGRTLPAVSSSGWSRTADCWSKGPTKKITAIYRHTSVWNAKDLPLKLSNGLGRSAAGRDR